MAGALVSRLPFLIAAALVAAAVADPIVESIANAGLVGPGYDDNDHLGVIPTLVGGLLLVLEILAVRCLEIWRRSASRSPQRLIDIARGFSRRSPARDLPLVFGMQLVALFALESAEQLTSGGKLLGGTAWLGGPVVFSLLVHALVGATCTALLGAAMRTVVRAFASLVATAIRFTWLAVARPDGGAVDLDRRRAAVLRAQAPHVRQVGGRAPPLVVLAA